MLSRSARAMYMAEVIAFFAAGRFNWTRKMGPKRSVIMSLIADLLGSLRKRSWRPDDATGAQAFDFFRVELEFLENFFIVFSNFWCPLRRNFAHVMHLNRTADRRRYFIAGSFQRNDDVVCPELRVIDDFFWLTHGTEGDVNATENLIPVRHRL